MRTRFRFIALVLSFSAAISHLELAHGSDAEGRASLRRFLAGYSGDASHLSTFADLRDDGAKEAVVYLNGPSWCGTGGCTLLILAPENSTYKLVTKITVVRLPVRALESKTNGWHDLGVHVAGGGIRKGYEAKLPFDGKTYPRNPTVPPAIRLTGGIPGTILISSNETLAAQQDDTLSAVEHVLRTQQDAWNGHDLDAFMTGYWNSPELTFFSGAKESKGWQATIDRYRATYQSAGKEMGKLEFSELNIQSLGPDAAFVRGVWQLTMTDGKTPHGRFTLMFRKFPDGWKIIHDHTSAAE